MYYFTNVTVTSCSKQCYLNFKLNLIVSTGLKQAFEHQLSSLQDFLLHNKF